MIYPHVEYLGPAYPDGSVATTMRELQSRVDDEIHVELLWCQRDGRVWVAVTDLKADESLWLLVRDGECALDVFHHPYAYAASQDVDTGATSRPVDSETSLAAQSLRPIVATAKAGGAAPRRHAIVERLAL
jgi:hypothetical protein